MITSLTATFEGKDAPNPGIVASVIREAVIASAVNRAA